MGQKIMFPAGRSKRVISAFIIFVLFTLSVNAASAGEARQLNVLTSFLPIYIFTKNVIGDRKGVELNSLLPGNAGPHDYQMRPSDMRKVADADLIIINGAGLESFAEKVLAGGREKGAVFEASKGLPLLEAADVEEGDGHSRDEHKHDDHHDHGGEFNPHTWVSPRLAAMQVRNIIGFLSQADPDGAPEYHRNGDAYVEKLKALEGEMKDGLKNLSSRKIITVHSAFDYLARDLGLELSDVIYHMPGEEPSAARLAALSGVIKKEGVRAIFSEPQFSDKMARLLASETGAAVYMLDPVATGTPSTDYYEVVMRENLHTLKKALGR